MGSKNKAKKTKEENKSKNIESMDDLKAEEHMEQLQRLQEKDPEFYEFLKEHDKELLEFDEDSNEDVEIDEEEEETDEHNIEHLTRAAEKDLPSKNTITSTMVDSWCNAIQGNANLGAVRSLMRAFRTACHYGDDSGDDNTTKFSVMSSSVFNKIMLFVLTEMDGILRGLLRLPSSGGKKETIMDLMTTRPWKNYNNLVKSYLGNALHVLNQMTDSEMISFTLRKLRNSSVFLAAFPALLRKYIKVALHFWGTGGGALPIVSFLFLRDLCIRLGSDCLDDSIRGMYKGYVLNCQLVNATKLQHIQFLGNCFIELLRVDLPSSYQHAFTYIRQLAMILKEALSESTKKKEIFRKVYQWKYVNCLELWAGAICAYSSEGDLMPLAYPLSQIISGVARLVPTACYFPLRLRCVRMLNRIAASTGTFIPVSLLLLDMLEMKELHKPPTGGVGKAVDLRAVLKVSKTTLKTRAFQEACVFSVVEELTEHLAQWSYSVAFFELSFVPAVRLRNFCKTTKVDRFRREMRKLIHEINTNSEFINKKRATVSFMPNDLEAASFLEDEKKSEASPLSQYAATLRQRAQQRNDTMMESSVLIGEKSSILGNKMEDDEEDDDNSHGKEARVFNSSWLPGRDSKINPNEDEKKVKTKKKKKQKEPQEQTALDEDVVEDFVLSSDEDEDGSISDPTDAEDVESERRNRKMHIKRQKPPVGSLKKKRKFQEQKSKKRKRVNRA
ncbi:Nucleolar complex protein 2-like protein [Forsythia ovata]|uniref:Nucleolar complex protein 2-like protein n=1 Tax=Forsythia ovata TaxID=205694 RepID=A0ABD1X5A5_9LAMI